VVSKLVAALRPGGHLVVEDYDVRTMGLTLGACDDWHVVHRAVIATLARRGVDLLCGQHLPALLRQAGMTDVRAEGFVHPMTIPQLEPVFGAALRQLSDLLLESGAVTQAQLDRVLAEFDRRHDAALAYTPILVSAWGRRPA
jgi:hypothetical protein